MIHIKVWKLLRLLIHIAMPRKDRSLSYTELLCILSNVLIIVKKTYFDDNLVCFYLIASLSVAWICNLKMIQANDLNRIYKIYNCQVNWNAKANICNNPYKVIPRTKLLRRFIVCEHNFLNIFILRTVWTNFTVKDTYISKWLKPMWT